MTIEPLRRLAVALCALALVATACGGDDDDTAEAGGDAVTTEATSPTQGGASTGSEESESSDDTTVDGDLTDETGTADDATDASGETGGAGSTTGADDATDDAGGGTDGETGDASTTTAAGGGSSPFTLEPGEKAIPDTALVFLRPVPGAVYTYSNSIGGGTVTYTVDGATENAGGLDVDVSLTGSFPTGDVEIGYLFRYLADGSIEVPFTDFTSLGEGGITFVEQPNFQLLDQTAVDSGSEFSGTTRAVIDIGGQQISADYAFVGRGLPPEQVTVPAGTFTATPIQFDITISIDGAAQSTATLQTTYYLNAEIGLVRGTFTSDLVGEGSTDLVSCSLL